MTEKNLQQSWYQDNYSKINATGNPRSISFRLLHRSLEIKADDSIGKVILEVGCGQAEHIPFVQKGWKKYVCSDIAMPSKETKKKIEEAGGIFLQADVHNLPFKDRQFDRLISTCLLHHLVDPHKAMCEMMRVVKIKGQISIFLPNDPGISFRILRRLTSGRKAKKFGIGAELKLIYALEHRNHYLQLMTLLNEVFKNQVIKIRQYPFKGLGYDFNAFTMINIRRIT
jgi:ubiquinone/menaquinone biosynthesis C-methylase UbiE